jgi:hypothetical protein
LLRGHHWDGWTSFFGIFGDGVCVCPVPLDVLKRLAAAAQDFDFFDLRLVSTKLMVMGRPMMGRPPGCLNALHTSHSNVMQFASPVLFDIFLTYL